MLNYRRCWEADKEGAGSVWLAWLQIITYAVEANVWPIRGVFAVAAINGHPQRKDQVSVPCHVPGVVSGRVGTLLWSLAGNELVISGNADGVAGAQQ